MTTDNLDEFLLEKSNGLGPAQDWTLMCGAAIDTLDLIIATGGTVPDLVAQTPLYFLNALRARMLLLVDVFEREQTRRTADTSDVNPMRDANLSPELEKRSRAIRDHANARVTSWLNGINPDDSP